MDRRRGPNMVTESLSDSPPDTAAPAVAQKPVSGAAAAAVSADARPGAPATTPQAATAGREADRPLDEAMERYVDGDAAAFDELYAGLAGRLYGYLLRLVRDRSRADDLLQITFLRLHSARNAWARGARVLPWAVTIARNAAYDDLRARKRARVTLTATGQVPEQAAPTEDTGVDAEVTEALERAMARLPEPYREAITLTKQLDMTVREAAQVAGTTETAMKLRAHRAYKRLREELDSSRANGGRP